ncbi:MAG: phospholipase D-like domain-containing protein [Chloroflexota bacterium]|nr:phospholipase D-like domain-containing protein [Chloroflexota bacterium]
MRRWLLISIVALAAIVALTAVFYFFPGETGQPTSQPDPVGTASAPTVLSEESQESTSQLTLWIQPEAGVEPIVNALEGAETSIRMKLYNLTQPDVIQALKDAAGRGIDVQLMVETNPYGGGSTTALLIPELRGAGIQFKADPRTFRYLHEKSIVVDDAIAYVMTANMTSSAVTANREYIVRTTDPAQVDEIAAVFDADWEREAIDLDNSLLHWAPDNSRQRIIDLFDSARTSLWIEHQNLQDSEIVQHVADAARRGVEVRYIGSPRFPIDEDSDEPGRERIRQAGAQVRYLDDPYVHAKVFVVDGKRGFVGSQNFTTNSLDNNRELGIDFADTEPVEQMVAQFESDWARGTADAFPDADKPMPAVIPHTDADKYYYRDDATVELTVQRIYNNPNGSVIWLMGDQNEDANFKVVFFPSAYGVFEEEYGAEPDEAFMDKTIQVTGLIEKYRGWPEIIVNDLEQVVVIE